MEIAIDKLTALVNEAYKCGLNGCADLQAQEVDELLKKYHVNNSDDFRVWDVKTLQSMPKGTVFAHILHGRCWINERANGTKYMQFNERGRIIDFNSDGDPWDKPMKLIHSEK